MAKTSLAPGTHPSQAARFPHRVLVCFSPVLSAHPTVPGKGSLRGGPALRRIHYCCHLYYQNNKVAQSHDLGTLVPLPRETDPFVKTQIFKHWLKI